MIETLREQLRRRRNELYRDILDSFPYREASDLVMDAVRSKLSCRAANILAGAGVARLEDFMVLSRWVLSRYRNCGTITADRILALQSGLAEFALRLDPAAADYSPESLLAAPCLQDGVTGRSGGQRRAALLADLENPAWWLIVWVCSLAPSPRHSMVFLLRRGMLGGSPLTGEKLREIAGGVSQGRIRQIDLEVIERASNPFQQYRLRPLLEELAAEVERRGGAAGREELLRAVLCRGEDGERFRSAAGLIEFFSKLPVWREAGLRLRRDGKVCREKRS